MAIARILPVDGRLIRDPFTKRAVPAEGLDISTDHPFWARALADGDVAIDLATIVAPLVGSDGQAIKPPPGNIADDIATPGRLAANRKGNNA